MFPAKFMQATSPRHRAFLSQFVGYIVICFQIRLPALVNEAGFGGKKYYMKRNSGKYKVVDKLPLGAMTVSEFAASEGISQSYVYKKIQRNTADYKIVVFKTMNFVVPLTKN
jgi:hypothetical protein